MRLLGYLLLFGGLASMSVFHYANLHNAKGRALARTLNNITESNEFSSEEVRNFVSGALDYMGASLPKIPVSALVMVGGGIVIDLANRRARKRNATS